MNSNSTSGMIFNFLEGLTELLVINVLWVAFNIPIVFFLINLLFVRDFNQLFAMGMVISMLMPFFYFPATAAMYAVIRKWIINKRDVPIVRSYWQHYKENFFKSLGGGIILVLIWWIFTIQYYLFTTYISNSLIFVCMFLFLLLYLSVFTMHFFSTLVHFELSVFKSLLNAGFVTLGKPQFTIGTGMLTGLIIYVSTVILPFLIPFFMGSFITLVSFYGFYRVFLKVQLQRKEFRSMQRDTSAYKAIQTTEKGEAG